MSDEVQHERDCQRFLGSPLSSVHQWMDAKFAEIGPRHRYVRHHAEGILEASQKFGWLGGRAALIHVLRDCYHLPIKADYESGAVDPLGIPTTMPVSDVVSFSEEAFMELVKRYLDLDQTGDVLIWGWLDDEDDMKEFLNSVTSHPEVVINDLRTRWTSAKDALTKPLLQDALSQIRYADGEFLGALEGFAELRSRIAETHGEVRFAFIKASAIISPLMVIDREFVDFLKQDLLEFQSEEHAVLFAFPPRVNVKVQTLSDARSATIITKFHQFELNGVRSEVVGDSGLDVTFSINPIPQLIIVTEYNGRFYLRAGMHRAFVLVLAGYLEIPCFVIKENNAPKVSGPYPTYPREVLKRERPPMLLDALDPTLTATINYRRTHRVLRIAAEDFLIPVE